MIIYYTYPQFSTAMRVSPGAIVWTLFVLGGASLVGQVVRVLSIDVDDPPEESTTTGNQPRESADGLGSEDNQLLWFIQVSISCQLQNDV